MKMNQIVFPLALTLAAMLATTGCKHTPLKVTPIPASQGGTVGGGDIVPPTIGGGGTIGGDPTGGVNIKTGGGETAMISGGDYNEDHTALAVDTIHFAFDSSVIRKNDHMNLEAVASALKGNANDKLLIEGNCDEKGTSEYNRALGERRALAAREALAKAGVSPDRIRTISYGKDKPADPGHDEAAWGKNRRDDFILLHPKMGA